jgi:uncharacterized damage-inducible protein DinB
MKTAGLTLLLCTALISQTKPAQDPYEGLWQGYEGEWGHVSRQLVALAEAIPAEKYSWRPATGVRSTSEVFMHIAINNIGLLSYTKPKSPEMERALDGIKINADTEKTVTNKADVIDWLKRSLEAVRAARADVKPADFKRKVKVENRDATVDGMYLRIIVHANEHMGQLVAYARMNGIAPPWSQ